MSGSSLVHHPRHYTAHPSGVECIDIVEHLPFNTGSLVKYLWRTGLKDAPGQELAKARWYADREASRVRKHHEAAHEHLVQCLAQVLAVEPAGTPLRAALEVVAQVLAGRADVCPGTFERLAALLHVEG